MATLACAKAFEPTHPADNEELMKLITECSKYHYQLTKDAAMGEDIPYMITKMYLFSVQVKDLTDTSLH